MADGTVTGDRLPVPVGAYGPLNHLGIRVHQLAVGGRRTEALALAREYEAAARILGDERTVGFLMHARAFAYAGLGYHEEARAVGEALLAHHRAYGNELGEARVLADLAGWCMWAGHVAAGMGYLARAGLALEGTTRRGDRYNVALVAYADAAAAAELYESANAAHELLRGSLQSDGTPVGTTFAEEHLELLLQWALRLDHVGYTTDAQRVYRRALAVADAWFADDPEPDRTDWVTAFRALALAELGDPEQAATLVRPLVTGLREQEQWWEAQVAHLAYGVALRALGEHRAARRELLAARELCTLHGMASELLVIQYELAVTAAGRAGPAADPDLLDTVREQARQLWHQRLQRLAMLRQARAREEAEARRERAEAALTRDPLTGLGNRRRFDELIAAVDRGHPGGPTSVLVVDVDRFKAVNDRYSHTVGDAVLREIAAVLHRHCRRGDVAVRYAGDEFALFLRADAGTAVAVAERIRAAVAATDFEHLVPGLPVRISVGVATATPGMSGTDLFKTADDRLYRAKRGGRDRVAH